MREESHLEDMRSALRGDFERLAERRGSQELMRPPEPADEPEPEPEVVLEQEETEPETEPELEVVLEEPETEPDPDPDPEPEVVADVEPEPAQPEGLDEPEEPPRRSFLDRLLGR